MFISRTKTILVLLSITFLVGCKNNLKQNPIFSDVTPIDITSIPQSMMITDLPSNTPKTPIPRKSSTADSVSTSKTSIQPLITKTLTPTKVITQQPYDQTIPICGGQGVTNDLPEGFRFNGTIIYQAGHLQGLFSLGGDPIAKGSLQVPPNEEVFVVGFSPDGNWLAYLPVQETSDEANPFETPRLILLSGDGQRVEQVLDLTGLAEELPIWCSGCQNDKFYDAWGEWLNNDFLQLKLFSQSQEGGLNFQMPTVYDPFSGSWQNQWLANLPSRLISGPAYQTIWEVKLSPDLTRAMYPYEMGGMILYDLVEKRTVWSDPQFLVDNGVLVSWSPDSKMVAIMNNTNQDYRLYLIDRNGETKGLVRDKKPKNNLYVTNWAWSPDSRYLAYSDSYSTHTLYLYDTLLQRYVYSCPLTEVETYPQFTWSPDSKWIVYGDHEPQANKPMHILRAPTGEVFRLPVNGIPLGWSEKFPANWP